MSADRATRLERPPLPRSAPNRSAGNFYRAATDNRSVVAGVPQDDLADAATAAVRLGYKIAAAQIDRTAAVAKRLREAGDRATGATSDTGDSTEKRALDATEQLVFNGLMAGLSWIEGIASGSGHPLKRVASAQFRLLGSLLGLLPTEEQAAAAPAAAAIPPAGAGVAQAPPTVAAARAPGAARALPRIKHVAKPDAPIGRPVRIRVWELAAEAVGPYPLTFYGNAPAADSIHGTLVASLTAATTLEIETPGATSAGIYRAAICDADGIQLGAIEIEL